METSVQGSSSVHRGISLIAVITVTFGIGLAAYDTVRQPSSDANALGAAVASSPARPAVSGTDASAVRSESPTPRFERSNEPAIDVDSVNAHGG